MAEDIALMLMEILPSLTRETIALFIIVDPLGNVPTFMSLTRDMSNDERRKAFFF